MAAEARADEARSENRYMAGTIETDEVSVQPLGTRSDPNSMAVHYRSDGSNPGIIKANPALSGFVAVIQLQDLRWMRFGSDNKLIELRAVAKGAFGIHDQRKVCTAARYPTSSVNLVYSAAYLDDMQLVRATQGMDLLQELLTYDAPDMTLYHLAQALLPAFQEPCERNQLFVDQVALAACTYIISRYGERPPSPSATGGLSRREEDIAKQFMLDNLHDNISLADVASLSGMTAPHFARSFKRSTGVSPYRWLTLQRVERAQMLLRSSDRPLTEIALACGFSSQSHFTNRFSRVVGASPRVWKRNIKD